jgi:hypothetical protein
MTRLHVIPAEDRGHVRGGQAMQMNVNFGRPLDHGPGRGSGWAARAAPWSGDMAPWGAGARRGPRPLSAAPPPYDAGTSPKSASPDDGAYASCYRDREHVNEYE